VLKAAGVNAFHGAQASSAVAWSSQRVHDRPWTVMFESRALYRSWHILTQVGRAHVWAMQRTSLGTWSMIYVSMPTYA